MEWMDGVNGLGMEACGWRSGYGWAYHTCHFSDGARCLFISIEEGEKKERREGEEREKKERRKREEREKKGRENECVYACLKGGFLRIWATPPI